LKDELREEPMRHLVAVPLLLAAGSVASTPPDAGSAAAPAVVSLRIESLTPTSLRVRVSAVPAGVWLDSATAEDARSELVLRTPAVLHVADPVQTVRVSVLGAGSVRLTFGGAASVAERRLAPWGRDITLTRDDTGRFRPIVRVHPLIP
jgi:hypothetical protein